MEDDVTRHLNKFEFPWTKDVLWQVETGPVVPEKIKCGKIQTMTSAKNVDQDISLINISCELKRKGKETKEVGGWMKKKYVREWYKVREYRRIKRIRFKHPNIRSQSITLLWSSNIFGKMWWLHLMKLKAEIKCKFIWSTNGKLTCFTVRSCPSAHAGTRIRPYRVLTSAPIHTGVVGAFVDIFKLRIKF